MSNDQALDRDEARCRPIAPRTRLETIVSERPSFGHFPSSLPFPELHSVATEDYIFYVRVFETLSALNGSAD